MNRRWISLIGVGLAWLTPGAAAEPPAKVAWTETTTVARGGWGRMIRLADGGWLAVSTRFAGPVSTLRLLHGTDSARTWTALAEVAEPGRLMDNGDLIRLGDGTLLLTGRSLIQGESYQLPVYRSTDSGRTWSRCGMIDSNDGPPGTLLGRGLWEPHFYQLPDGRLAVAYANEKHAADPRPYSQVCTVRVSPDSGRTWGRELTLAAEPGGGKQRPGMPVVTRMTDGRYLAVYEVVGIGDAEVFSKISADGEQWPAGLGSRIPGHHAGPWVTSLTDGRLLLTSCSNTLSVSADRGRTWQPLEPPAWDVGPGKNFTWPAIYQTRPDEIAVMVAWRGVQLRFGAIGGGKPGAIP